MWTINGQIWTKNGQVWTKNGQVWTKNGQIWTKSGQIWTKYGSKSNIFGHCAPVGYRLVQQMWGEPINNCFLAIEGGATT